jgi:hypothetical protein
MDVMRIGLGYDSHAFQPGVPLVIGGLKIEHHSGLAGHSDGDVLLHAITCWARFLLGISARFFRRAMRGGRMPTRPFFLARLWKKLRLPATAL